jgi:hypothetical protein
MYRKTHQHHPCVKWAAECANNYDWLYDLFIYLGDEYTKRYGKQHLSLRKLCSELELSPQSRKKIDVRHAYRRQTPSWFALAMPDKYKTSCEVESYHNFYRGEKSNLLTWKNTDTPEEFK